MKKKILSLIFATTLVASVLTACGNKNTDTTDTASAPKETTVVGSDDDGESSPAESNETSETTADTPVTGDAPADEGDTSYAPTTFDEKIADAVEIATETFGSDGIPALGVEFTDEALESYMEEYSNRMVIAFAFLSAGTNNTISVYNPENYDNTLEMIKDAQANYKFGSNIFYLQDNRDEQIAKAIDALTESLGTHVVVMVIDAGDSYSVMFYCDNGIGYGVRNANDEYTEFSTGSYDSEGYDASNPHFYNVYADGTVETQF